MYKRQTLNCVRNPALAGEYPLQLDGEDLETLSVSLDGRLLSADDYSLSANQLVLNGLPERFTLQTRVRIQPDSNTQLSGPVSYTHLDVYKRQAIASCVAG